MTSSMAEVSHKWGTHNAYISAQTTTILGVPMPPSGFLVCQNSQNSEEQRVNCIVN